MLFSLDNLEYDYAALEPVIDEQTMRIHHGKHHQAYVDNLNAALEKLPDFNGEIYQRIVQIVEASGQEAVLKFIVSQSAENFGDLAATIFNNAGGHLNHTFFWECLRPAHSDNQPRDQLAEKLSQNFGSLENFQAEFEKAALGRFGSGWAWLVKDNDNNLQITSTANQDSPISSRLTPVLGLDVWEHAYYLKYQNRRPDYVAAFWQVVNWDFVESNAF